LGEVPFGAELSDPFAEVLDQGPVEHWDQTLYALYAAINIQCVSWLDRELEGQLIRRFLAAERFSAAIVVRFLALVFDWPWAELLRCGLRALGSICSLPAGLP
jgi:hypothetical protein